MSGVIKMFLVNDKFNESWAWCERWGMTWMISNELRDEGREELRKRWGMRNEVRYKKRSERWWMWWEIKRSVKRLILKRKDENWCEGWEMKWKIGKEKKGDRMMSEMRNWRLKIIWELRNERVESCEFRVWRLESQRFWGWEIREETSDGRDE